jgi:peptide/nickel transport system substrate-binding protein
VAEFRPDQMLVLEAFDEYWGGRPPVRRLRFLEVPEASSRINMLLSGECDFACDVAPDQIRTVERSARHEVVGGPIMNHRLTVFDKNHPQLRDARIRRAFTHSIDRNAIVQALWGGRAPVPKGLQFEFYGEMFHTDWEAPRFDIAEARRLLREANYRGEPIPYRLLNNYYVNQVPTSQVLVEMWKQVGINVAIEMKESFVQLRDRTLPRGVRDWSSGATLNDPVGSLVSNFGPNGAAQQAREYANDEFSKLCVLLETSADRALRKKAFARMLQIAEREDPAYIMLHQAATFTAKRKDIKWKAMPAYQMDFGPGNFAL